MIQRLKQIWLPAAGSFSSITVSAAENIKLNTASVITPMQLLITNNPLLYYFLIGVAGAMGGLIVKILWGVIKRKFPALKGIDK